MLLNTSFPIVRPVNSPPGHHWNTVAGPGGPSGLPSAAHDSVSGEEFEIEHLIGKPAPWKPDTTQRMVDPLPEAAKAKSTKNVPAPVKRLLRSLIENVFASEMLSTGLASLEGGTSWRYWFANAESLEN
jgi:hypothetical protein